MRRFLITAAAAAVMALGVRTLLSRRVTIRKAAARHADRLARLGRYRLGQLDGVSYRLRGRHPDADVADLVLADRIRSSIGPLEARLDVPHVHVMVEDHTALLHGDVASSGEATEIEDAVAAVPGVVGVESYLHIGLLPSDSRPSEGGRRRPDSAALGALVDAVTGAGIADVRVRPVLRAILATLAGRVPSGELDHVLAHLPGDVRQMMEPPRRRGTHPDRVRTVSEMVARIRSVEPVPVEMAEQSVRAAFAVLRRLVPEESADIGAVLPAELRSLWNGAEHERS